MLTILQGCRTGTTFFLVNRGIQGRPRVIGRVSRRKRVITGRASSRHSVFPLDRKAGITRRLRRYRGSVTRIVNGAPVFFHPPFNIAGPIVKGIIGRVKLRAVN